MENDDGQLNDYSEHINESQRIGISQNSIPPLDKKNMLLLIASAVIVIGFFLPLINSFLGSISGFDLLQFALNNNVEGKGTKAAFFILAIPIVALIIFIVELASGPKRKVILLISQLVIIVSELYGLIKIDTFLNFGSGQMTEEIFKVIGVGLYMILAGGIIMIINVILSVSTTMPVLTQMIDGTHIGPNVLPKRKEEVTIENIPPANNFTLPTETEVIEFVNKILEQIKKRWVILAAFVGLIGVILLILWIIEPNPAKNAQQAGNAFCECSKKYNDALIESDLEFINSFNTIKYTTRTDARNRLAELQNKANSENSDCINKAQLNYNAIRGKFAKSQENTLKFDNAFNTWQNTCLPENKFKADSAYDLTQSKIAEITYSEPGINQIKTDLLGKQILGWTFSALSEFDQAIIANTQNADDMLEYTIDLHLIGYQNPATDIHDAQIIVNYTLGDAGWSLNFVKEVYITTTYRAQVNQWTPINIYPNCSYHIDNSQKYWVQDGNWGPKLMGGPGGVVLHLTSSQIFVLSREDHDIDLVFKYTPNN